MQKSNKINMIIALLIAIALWAYVIIDKDPQSEDTIKNVPIAIINESSLSNEGLILLSIDLETVTVKISGKHSETSKVKASDIKVVADLEGLSEGEHKIRLKTTGPESVKIIGLNRDNVTVVIDKKVTEEKPVVATFVGEDSDESEPYIVQVSRENVKVTGAKTLIDSIVSLNAPLDVSKVDNQLKAFNVGLVAVDENGAEVEGVTLKHENVSISAVLLNKKTVKIEVPVIGLETGEAERTVTLPKTITIKGTDADLLNIQTITAQSIDVSQIYEDTSLPIVPLLPEGVEVAANSQNLTAKVSVKSVVAKTITFDMEDIVLEGVTEEMTVAITETSVQADIRGKEDVVSDLKKVDFYLWADVSNLQAGTHILELKYRCEKNPGEIIITPKEIEVKIDGRI